MILFQTSRLIIRRLEPSDKLGFAELLQDPEILKLIPREPAPMHEVEERFSQFLQLSNNINLQETVVLGIQLKEHLGMIGICALLTNEDNDRELGYRIRKPYWKNGYGTEVTKGLIDFCFNELQWNKVTADVNVDNVPSVKILEKFFTSFIVFYNKEDQCTNRRYTLYRSEWDKM